LIALEPEAASIYVRQLRLSQLVPERHTVTRAHDAPAGHVIVNGGATDPAAVEFHTGLTQLSFAAFSQLVSK